MIQPGTAFKKSARRAIVQIVQFIIGYILLLVAGAVFAAGCVIGGIALVFAVPNFMVLMVSLGLIGLGLMVLFFLLKFLFSVSRQDRSGYIRITDTEQPELFATIRQLSDEIGAPFPKNVYLSPDVNASVFYDSGFWSMFLPVKKNLVIGLGLVNSLNTGEFKAVLAHEFGHFSQKSMKIGSYVYQVNRVIHNMLYDNEGYGKFLSGWANVSGYFAFFATITVKVVEVIQGLLRDMYKHVNKSYLGLSREMEFHADAVAAEVAGGNNLVSALNKLQLGDSTYQAVLQTCNGWLEKNELSKNFYGPQRFLMKNLAAEYGFPITNEIPDVLPDHPDNDSFCRVSIQDQWASHPPIAERTHALVALKMDRAPDTSQAWSLFESPVGLQESLTALVYKAGGIDAGGKTILGNEDFADLHEKTSEAYSLPEEYRKCYDGRPLSELDLDALPAGIVLPASWQELCTEEQASLIRKISGAEQDLALLASIMNKELEISSFDFEGARYQAADAAAVNEKIQSDVEGWKKAIMQFDSAMCSLALGSGIQREALREAYLTYAAKVKNGEAFSFAMARAFERFEPVFKASSLTLEEVTSIITDIKINHEPVLKQFLREYQALLLFEKEPDLDEKIRNFLAADFVYFNNGEYFNSELQIFVQLYNDTIALLQEYLFRQFKALLMLQLNCLNSPAPASADPLILLSAETVQPIVGNVP